MDQFPYQRHQAASGLPPGARGLHAAMLPKSWLGKLLAAIVGLATMLVALFLSIFLFAVIASVAVVGVLYVMWVARRARRASESQIIDNQAGDQGPRGP